VGEERSREMSRSKKLFSTKQRSEFTGVPFEVELEKEANGKIMLTVRWNWKPEHKHWKRNVFVELP
jgi:hypothetical protein